LARSSSLDAARPGFSQAARRCILPEPGVLMRRLMLLRHAKSDWSTPGMRDQDRPLNARGREAAPKMGAYMARHGLVPDLIIASPATRVTETLALVLPAFAKQPKTMPDIRLYETDAAEILKVIKEAPRSVHSLLLAGHNP